MHLRSCDILAILIWLFFVVLLAVFNVLATTAIVGSRCIGSLKLPSTTSTALSFEASPHTPLRILVRRSVRDPAFGMLQRVGYVICGMVTVACMRFLLWRVVAGVLTLPAVVTAP